MFPPGGGNPNKPISLDDALNTYGGSFLFAPLAPNFTDTATANTFAWAVQAWLADGGTFFGRYFVWLPRAANPPVFGSPTYAPNASNGFAFSFSQQSAGWTLQSSFNSLVGLNMWLSIAAGVYISVQNDTLQFYGPQAPGIGYNSPQALQLTVPSNLAVIPLAGPSAGCVVLGGGLTVASQLGGFLIGMQYAFGQASSASDVVQQFQVLDVTNTPSLDYVAAFDPIDPLCTGPASNPAAGIYRTIIAAAPGTAALASLFRTVNNDPVALTPRSTASLATGPSPQDGGFIFQPVGPLQIGANLLPVQANVYMTPAGDYLTGAAGTNGTVVLIPGLAGTENFALDPVGAASADALRFVGVSPAYTPQFPLPPSDIANPTTGKAQPTLPVTNPPTYITSWAQVVPGQGSTPTYSAQPQGNALYGPGGAFSGNSKTVAGALRPTTSIGAVDFPIVAWAGASGAIPVAGWGEYESKVLSATRRNALQSLARAQAKAAKTLRAASLAALNATADATVGATITPNGTTPQGLLAQLDQSSGHSNYEAVILAQSDDLGTPTSQMSFQNVDAVLQGLFQTNQLFAVITNPAHLGQFANVVDIAGWKMEANVGAKSASSNVSNVMIMKFCEGTLSDLVDKPSAWTDPDDFSNPDPSIGVAVLSQALRQYIDIAMKAAQGGNTLYSNFADIVTNPEWRGILVLGADISPTDLPPQLAGLAAGINFTNFRAHHFGVSVSPVSYDGQTLKIPGSSSLFGLVDYQLPAFAQSVAGGAPPSLPLALPSSGAYDFTVLQLQSLFENSALVDFRSHVQVTTNVLFGSKVTASFFNATRQAANSVVLTGYYQSEGGQGTYLFESDVPTVMVTDSNVLRSVLVSKVVFNTLTNNDKGTPPSILSRILITGSFNFAVLMSQADTAFDLMSYGMAADTPPATASGGLAFSNLHIDMSSPVASPNVTTYTIVEDNLAFDLANSLLREGSVVSGLTLQPQAFLVSAAGTTPAARGYLPVVLDEGAPPQTAVTQVWYGVSCLINMGGPGALASAAGFNSTLLMAWSPQTLQSATSYAAFAGLQLPGASPGASAFSLQGVVNLKVDTISLSLGPVAGGGPDAFTLRLSDISLSFLGIAKLPSGSSIDLFVFGSPDGKGALGWYGALVQDQGQSAALSGGASI
ncbi:hypothetical protein ASD38_20615 [Caulobacter sp. Root487D2Y]|nr:hypothetical protein ASD38_20615 [Caulobacter sp. Root487D2Y]